MPATTLFSPTDVHDDSDPAAMLKVLRVLLLLRVECPGEAVIDADLLKGTGSSLLTPTEHKFVSFFYFKAATNLLTLLALEDSNKADAEPTPDEPEPTPDEPEPTPSEPEPSPAEPEPEPVEEDPELIAAEKAAQEAALLAQQAAEVGL